MIALLMRLVAGTALMLLVVVLALLFIKMGYELLF